MSNRYRSRPLFCLIIIYLSLFLAEIPALAVSLEDERKLGEQFVESVRPYIVEDDFLNDYINRLGHFLVESLEIKHFPYNFYVINENDLNAFAVPGGHIFIFTGLIEALDEIDELAGVMCHELAHITSRHYAQRVEQYKKIGIASMLGLLAGMLVGGEAADAIITGTMAAAQQKALNYSRDDERQADQAGFKYCLQSGFDPHAIKSVFNKLQRGQWAINSIPPYLLTHPLGSERMANIDALLASSGPPVPKDETAYFRKTYPVFRTIIKAGYGDEMNSERYYSDEVKNNPDSPLGHLGMAIIHKKKMNYSGAIDHFKIAAERLAEPQLVFRYLSEAYQLNGEEAKAIEVLEQILYKEPHDKTSLLLLANVYRNIEKYSMAADIYEKLKFMEPVKDEVFYNLGMSYGRQNILGPAHYNFGLYFKRLKQHDKAEFHFKKAKEETKDNPELIEKIDRVMEEMKNDNHPSSESSEKRPEWSDLRPQ